MKFKILIWLLLLSQLTSASDTKETRIEILKARGEAFYRQMAIKEETSDYYVVHVNSGESLRIRVYGREGVAIRKIRGPDLSLDIDNNLDFTDVQDWSKKITESGDYHFSIYSFLETDLPVTYDLKVEVH